MRKQKHLKTVKIAALLEAFDALVQYEPGEHLLQGASVMLERALFAAENYRGYNHVNSRGEFIPLDDPEFHEYRRHYYGER